MYLVLQPRRAPVKGHQERAEAASRTWNSASSPRRYPPCSPPRTRTRTRTRTRKLQQHNSILEGILNTKQAELAGQEAELLTARSVIPTQAPPQAPPLATTGLSPHTNALRLAARELRTEARAARRETFMLGGGTVDELRPDWARSLCSSLVAVRVPGECGWGARGLPGRHAAYSTHPMRMCTCADVAAARPPADCGREASARGVTAPRRAAMGYHGPRAK